ncbi:hypothetical protein ACLKA7_000377 [Drosophila subpalustris]
MNYRNCSVLDILLLILLLLDSSWSLTSPDCNQDTHELEKYVVSIRSRSPQVIFGDNHFCVGTIIAPKFVLTAAKCTMSTLKVMHLTRSLIVVGGTPNRLIEVQNTVSRKVKDIFLPENFVKKNRNDIALIQLQESWPTNNPGIDIINLPSEEPTNGTEFLVLGWGRFYKGGPLAGNLVHIKVELLEHSKCNQMIQKLQPEMLCAGNVSDIDMNPCAGDTGGPMIYNHTIYGLVSYRTKSNFDSLPHRSKRIAEGFLVTRLEKLKTSVVSLRSRSPEAYFGDNHFCSGSLLNDMFIITSARCITYSTKIELRPREIVVVAGSTERLNHTEYTIQLIVTFVAVHVNFTMYNYNDIALLRTVPVEQGGPKVDVLPALIQEPPYGTKCTVMGWGRLFKDGPLGAQLTMLDVELYTPEYCRSLIPLFGADMLCAGNLHESNVVPTGPCPGDTGGPLFCNNSLTGIVSYTLGCAQHNVPSIYTNVHHHLDWINEYLDRGGKAMLQLQPHLYLLPLTLLLYWV